MQNETSKEGQRSLMELADWRKRIDELDADLVRLLNERSKCVGEIGKIKRAHHLNLYDPVRETEVFRNVLAHNQGPLRDDALGRIFERIIDESRRLERTVMRP